MNSADRQSVDIGDRALSVRVRGAGPTVVLEAGSAGEGTTRVGYGRVLEEQLAAFATVLTYDRAGSGHSAGPPRRSVAEMADDLDALIGAVRCPTPVIVVGWSSGGLVAEMFAVRHPDKLAGLVLLDPTVEMDSEPRIVQYLRLAVGTAQLGVNAVAAQLGFFATPAGRFLVRRTFGPDASAESRAYAYHAAENARAMWELTRAMPLFDGYIAETAAALRRGPLPDIPVRVVIPRSRAGLPPTYPRRLDAAHRALAARFPRGELVVADRATHLVPIERPDLVLAIVGDLLGR